MFLYKLKKIFTEKRKEIIWSSLSFSLIVTFLSFFLIALIYDYSKSEKKQLFLTSVILTSVNFIIIYFTDFFFDFNVIITIILGYIFSFFIFLVPCLLIILYFEMSEITVDMSEMRELKLKSLLRNLF
jgi:xanthine/uracil permease